MKQLSGWQESADSVKMRFTSSTMDYAERAWKGLFFKREGDEYGNNTGCLSVR